VSKTPNLVQKPTGPQKNAPSVNLPPVTVIPKTPNTAMPGRIVQNDVGGRGPSNNK
jgi:hypothetical protein